MACAADVGLFEREAWAERWHLASPAYTALILNTVRLASLHSGGTPERERPSDNVENKGLTENTALW